MRNSSSSIIIKIAVSFIIVLLFSCDKETQPKVDHRVISTKRYLNGVQDNYQSFTYSDDKVQHINACCIYQYHDSVRFEYQYPDDNTAILNFYEKKDDTWEQTVKQELDFQDGILSKYINYELAGTNWEANYKMTLTIQNSKIVHQITEWLDSIEWKTISQADYEYDGDKLVNKLGYAQVSGNWELSAKEEVTYEGENVDFITSYKYNNGMPVLYRKFDFSYHGDQIISMEYFDYEASDSSWALYRSMEFTYNDNGDLASEFESAYDAVIKTEYYYETGKGNYEMLYNVPFNLYDLYTPGPVKTLTSL